MKKHTLFAAAVLLSLSAPLFAAEAGFDQSVGEVLNTVDTLKGPFHGGFQQGHDNQGGNGQHSGFGDHGGNNPQPNSDFGGHGGNHGGHDIPQPPIPQPQPWNPGPGHDNHPGPQPQPWDPGHGHDNHPGPQPQPWNPGPGHDNHPGPQPQPWDPGHGHDNHPGPQPWHPQPQPEPWHPQPQPEPWHPQPQPEPWNPPPPPPQPWNPPPPPPYTPVEPIPAKNEIYLQSSGSIGGALYLTFADTKADYFRGEKIDISVDAMALPGAGASSQDILNSLGHIIVQGTYDVSPLYSIKLADRPNPGRYILTIKYLRRGPHSSGAEGSTIEMLDIP